MPFTCYYCCFEGDFDRVVEHCTELHSNQILKIRRKEINDRNGRKGLRTLNFNIIPDILKSTNKQILPSYQHGTPNIEIIDIDIDEEDFGLCDLSLEEPCNSPFLKRTKTSTPQKIAQETPKDNEMLFTASLLEEDMIECSVDEDDQEMINEINRILPDVIKSLRDIDQLQNWLSFHQMIKEGRFPLENIAFHLFMDVCKFYSLGNTASMRFSPVVKRFWRIGYCLFHGKWLHFMSGPKNLGQKFINPDEEISAENAEINFAVPYRATVGNRNKLFSEDDVKPGLLIPMIDKLASQTRVDKTYKLCVDGKKINAGKSKKHGDIDLFGFEKPPTLSDRRATLEGETLLLKSVADILDVMSICQKTKLKQIPENETKHLIQLLIEVVRVVGEKLHTLRSTKVSKELMLEKLKKQSGPDWRKSKFVFVISSLETDLYDVSNCIKELLDIVDEIGFTVATLRDAEKLYAKGRSVSLHSQMNYIHISSTSEGTGYVEPRHIKQLSDKWHAIRNSAKVTGSSLNKALGLGSLKQQLEHFDKVFFKKEPKQVSSDVQLKMKYGSEQEINAIATLVSKVLPVFEPSLIYVEEGCYKKTIGTEPNEVPIVVSPDGSIRNSADSTASFGVECKCPYPGKIFTTPVYYEIPKYYVTQVLAEMFVMDCNALYFICYSKDSSTVFHVQFCPDLWSDLENETVAIYGQKHAIRPAKKSNRVFAINEKIDKFVNENVKFVGEFPSILGEECKIKTSEIYCIHTKSNREIEIPTLRDLQETVQKAIVSINRAYELSRTRASEFLGFMVSDLDREYNSERYHAVPVAYGLKGYSLPTQTLRDIIEYVLRECWSKGLYIPICSFDGQWFRMAVRDRNEKPLTVLQLQKDVYADVKRMSKGQIIKSISELNLVQLQSDAVPEDIIEIRREGTKVILANGNKSAMIVMTPTLIQLLKRSFDAEESKPDENEPDNVMTDVVISALPEKYVNEIEEDLLDEVAVLASTLTGGNYEIEPGNADLEHVNALFDEPSSQSDDTVMEVDIIPENVHHSTGEATVSEPVSNSEDSFLKSLNTQEHLELMLFELQSKNINLEISLAELTSKLKTAEKINKSFTKNQVFTLISPLSGILKSKGFKCNVSQPKYKLTNILSEIFGDGSMIQQKPIRKVKVPLSLKSLARKAVQKLSKTILNCVYAQHIYPDALQRWQNDSPFGDNIQIEEVDNITPAKWYSKPEFNDVIGSYLFVILDAYHQICGLRRVFCGPGMPKAGVFSKPVNIIAENSDSNGSGLSIALVRDMIDKQSIAYAVQTFSENVEEALTEINACNEAYFCNIVRNWYLSEDEPGLSALDRCKARLEFRKWLLNGVRFDTFPPYGSYVKDIPVVLYEGLLIGIERKLQLYPFTKAGTYNVRAVGSLDIENFFGSFQDIDPRGTGVLRPADVPIAIGVAMELLDARLDPERGFYMNTSRKRVYPSKENMSACTTQQIIDDWDGPLRDVSTIRLRDHSFDLEERRRGKRTRKSGKVSKPNQPARNPFPVREYHKASEAKILPHVRRGLNLESFNDSW
ncbi:uncharacterized protein LOC123562931 [Mercenaria mercenaria]|uniref:uncharacterized protein LOC123562931 n=1 Tax=Mercenaria mercenaria TaxID=6596 RepID=UPI00234F714C|nr:uncharacterized protein LOC123562931 [Mercenaria mercenaria]